MRSLRLSHYDKFWHEIEVMELGLGEGAIAPENPLGYHQPKADLSKMTNFYIQRIQELEKLNPNACLENGVTVFCTEWSETDLVFDFYAVTETNPTEGRLSGTPVGQYNQSTNSWLLRSSGTIDLWVTGCDRGIYRVSFCHPECACGMEVSVGYGFGCPEGIAIATRENKDRDRFKRAVRDRSKVTDRDEKQLALKIGGE